MACGSSALVCFLLSFSGGGGGSVGVVSREDRWSLLLLLAVIVGVAGGVVIHGEQGVRLDLLYLLACGVELWSSPLLGSLSGWPASSSSTILDFFPASRHRICFLRWPWCGECRLLGCGLAVLAPGPSASGRRLLGWRWRIGCRSSLAAEMADVLGRPFTRLHRLAVSPPLRSPPCGLRHW